MKFIKSMMIFFQVLFACLISVDSVYAQYSNISGYWYKEGSIYRFKFETNFELNESIDGYFEWTLLDSPRNSEIIGGKAREYVRGTFDSQTRQLLVTGYKKDDPHKIISLDEYRLEVSKDGQYIFGATKGSGDWGGRLESRPREIGALEEYRRKIAAKDSQNKSSFAHSNGDPKKYSTTPSNSSCRFFDGFADNGDGTVTDPRNGLVWKRCAEGMNWSGSACLGKAVQLNWFEAMERAKKNRFLGKSDWRLPSIDELYAVLGVDKIQSTAACSKNYDSPGQYAASSSLAHDANLDDRLAGIFWSFSYYINDATTDRPAAYARTASFDWGGSSKPSGNIAIPEGKYPIEIDGMTRLVRSTQGIHENTSIEFGRAYAKLGELRKTTTRTVGLYRQEREAHDAKIRALDSEERKGQSRLQNMSRGGVDNFIALEVSKAYSVRCNSGFADTIFPLSTNGEYCGRASNDSWKCFQQPSLTAQHICQ